MGPVAWLISIFVACSTFGCMNGLAFNGAWWVKCSFFIVCNCILGVNATKRKKHTQANSYASMQPNAMCKKLMEKM